MGFNPYPKVIADEVSGIEVSNNDYYIWEEGFKAGVKEVVEFVLSHKLYAGNISIPRNVWQAKLKEFGVK